MMKKILVVEDEPGHLKTIIEYLMDTGQDYDLISATNGLNAFTIAETEIPDLIIMDWEMPVMNGLEATLKLKATPSTGAIPIIMCTGVMISSNDLQQSFNAGAIDFIRKPIDKIELLARVRSMLMLAEYFTDRNIAERKVEDLSREIQEQKIRQLQMQLNFKNKEITSKAMFLIQKDELIEMAIGKLISIMNSKSKDCNKKLAFLIKELKLNKCDNRWKEFEVAFEQVHEDFYQRLKTKFPDLTSNEKKLSGFIRLNMSTKDISAITMQSLKSIEVARSRLRQKLKLGSGENLNVFISNL
jgi:CheY-like chemotaxis protein